MKPTVLFALDPADLPLLVAAFENAAVTSAQAAMMCDPQYAEQMRREGQRFRQLEIRARHLADQHRSAAA